ncbi:hypothetical protein ACFFX1_23555 [Dactylosporangium sucinum]|uniref:Uncharacterized protein n=1 Tax=Dactylosporangium sucinum TaxID=1424081 RepID=A0A917UC05_9ACTN|nr:hypothetical protein [Dactylosporangium sucinum]GGM71150.1 hypothetical protein GCM10007977_086250 [Dactylosporangium sucinum]
MDVARSAITAQAITVLPEPGGATSTPSSCASRALTAEVLLAELALSILRSQTGQSMDELVRELNLLVEQALGTPPP